MQPTALPSDAPSAGRTAADADPAPEMPTAAAALAPSAKVIATGAPPRAACSPPHEGSRGEAPSDEGDEGAGDEDDGTSVGGVDASSRLLEPSRDGGMCKALEHRCKVMCPVTNATIEASAKM
mmetsp:Transcript_60782/g.185607  ORF Transcript_60782/g.185607 Transcript_60782/m.185607 type:complete len:123 (+) Transcript_60782:337-705(+)